MGTRRSRHNKGRKPLYKEHGSETIRGRFLDDSVVSTLAPANKGACYYCERKLEPHGSHSKLALTWDHYLPQVVGGIDVVPCCWECNNIKGDMLPDEWQLFMRTHPRWWESHRRERYKRATTFRRENRTEAEIELADDVKAYLEKRRTEALRKQEAEQFPTSWKMAPEKIILPSEHHAEAERVEPSSRDILIEMFVERKITAGQFHAGRRWQADRENASLQPNRSIDFSQSVSRNGFIYQTRGTITDGQWNAMGRRRQFIQFAGLAVATFLDFCLDADRGRADLIQMTGVSAVQIEASIEETLTKVCECFGRTWRERHQHFFRTETRSVA